MKIFRAIFASLGLSTFHLHSNPLLGSSSLSKVVPPVRPQNSIAGHTVQQQQQEIKIKFKVITFDDDSLPPPIIKEKIKTNWTRPPRSIQATRIPKYPQSKHRLR